VTVSSMVWKRPDRIDETDLREAEDEDTRGLGMSVEGGGDVPGISMGDGVEVGILIGEGGGKPASLKLERETPGL
jgi:hypothetical protein